MIYNDPKGEPPTLPIGSEGHLEEIRLYLTQGCDVTINMVFATDDALDDCCILGKKLGALCVAVL
jgi:hypothetical protein